MDFVGNTSTGRKQFKKICIREHGPEVQKRDREIYYPFSLSRNSLEHNHQANIDAPLLLENNVADHVICNDAIGSISDGNLESSASREMIDSHFQLENIVYVDTVDAIHDKRQDAVSDHDAVNNIKDNNNMVINNEVANTINGGPSESASTELNDPNRKDPMPCKNNTQHRNLEGKKLQKYRMLSDVYNGIEGSFLQVDPEDDSNDETLTTSIEKKKDVRPNCKNRGAVKEKRRTSQAVRRNLVRAKRTKHVSEGSCSKDSDHGSTSLNGFRKNKIGRLDMQVMKKLKRSTPEIVYENSGAACLDGQENTSEIKKDLRLLAGKERKRKTTQEDIAMMILKLKDGSWRQFTVEEKRSDISDTEIMVASWLIELSARVNTKKSDTETIQPTVSVCSLPQGKENESEICGMNRNPSEFSAEEAKTFMRCC